MYKYLAVISSVCILGVTIGMKPTNEISSHKEGDNSAKYSNSNIIDDIQFNKIKDSLDNNSNDLETSTDSSEYSDEDLEDSDEDSESEANSQMPIQVVHNSNQVEAINSIDKIVWIAKPKSCESHEMKNQKESEQLEQQLKLRLEQQLDNTSYGNYNDLSDSFNSNVMKTLLFYTVENQKKLAEEIAKSNPSNLTEEIAKSNPSNLTEEIAKPNLSNLKDKLELHHLRKIILYIHNKQDIQNFVLVSSNTRKAYYDVLDKQSAANSAKKDSTK